MVTNTSSLNSKTNSSKDNSDHSHPAHQEDKSVLPKTSAQDNGFGSSTYYPSSQVRQVYTSNDQEFKQAQALYCKLKLGITTPSTRIKAEFAQQHPEFCQLACTQQNSSSFIQPNDRTNDQSNLSYAADNMSKEQATAALRSASDSATTENSTSLSTALDNTNDESSTFSNESTNTTSKSAVCVTTIGDSSADPNNTLTTVLPKRRRNNQPHRALRYNSQAVLSMEQIMVNCMLSTAINLLLQAELNCFLGFERYTHTQRGASVRNAFTQYADTEIPIRPYEQKNLRNGFYTRNVSSRFGYISIKYPRDRFCSFVSHIIQKNTSQLNISEDAVLALYACSNDEQFEAVLHQLCDNRTNDAYIRNLARNVNLGFAKWRKHKLPDHSAFLCINNLSFQLKLYGINWLHALPQIQIWQVALGILPDGKHQIFSINPLTANPAFSSSFSYAVTVKNSHKTGRNVLPERLTASLWKNLLNDLNNRGLSEVDYVCMDGAFEALPHIFELFPKAKVMSGLILVEGATYDVTLPSRNYEIENKLDEQFKQDLEAHKSSTPKINALEQPTQEKEAERATDLESDSHEDKAPATKEKNAVTPHKSRRSIDQLEDLIGSFSD